MKESDDDDDDDDDLYRDAWDYMRLSDDEEATWAWFSAIGLI